MQTDDPETTGQEHTTELPERYREALYTTFDEVMPVEWLGDLGQWLHANRHTFQRGGDPAGELRFNYELNAIDDVYTPVAELRAAVVERIPAACEACKIPEFPLEFVESHAVLYHHGGHFIWHTDRDGYDGAPVPTRRLAYCLYLHSQPRMFNGGELEFLDGQMVEPRHNRLVMFSPYQQHRVRPVECWSADVLHGRWSVFGWIHGPAPGERAELEGVPRSG